MRYAIDSSAWIEYFRGSEEGAQVSELLDEEVETSVIALAEVADKFIREGFDPESAIDFIRTRAAIVSINPFIALKAAQIKNQQRKKKKKYGLIDAIHYATAQHLGSTLVSTDTDFNNQKDVLIL